MEPRITPWDQVYKDLGLYIWKPQLEKKPCQETATEQEHIN